MNRHEKVFFHKNLINPNFFVYFAKIIPSLNRSSTVHRIYDRAGEGFITMDTLRGLIGELLAPLTDEELDGIIEELDEDGSGTMDFDEFCEMMMSAPEK
jgi:Ca2+-binding EF-hand superfamily protein